MRAATRSIANTFPAAAVHAKQRYTLFLDLDWTVASWL